MKTTTRRDILKRGGLLAMLVNCGMLTMQQALAADAYADIRATGAFILIDEVTHQTVAAGMIRLD